MRLITIEVPDSLYEAINTVAEAKGITIVQASTEAFSSSYRAAWVENSKGMYPQPGESTWNGDRL